VKDVNGDLLAEFHNILNRWENYYSQFLNVDRVNDVRQRDVHRAETLIHDPSPFEDKIAITKLKICKLPSSDQILAELNQAGCETLWPEIHKLINSVWNKEELSDHGRSLLLLQ
jgi:hypothetical protein